MITKCKNLDYHPNDFSFKGSTKEECKVPNEENDSINGNVE